MLWNIRANSLRPIRRLFADDGSFVEKGANDGATDATRPSGNQNSFGGELKIHGAGLSWSG